MFNCQFFLVVFINDDSCLYCIILRHFLINDIFHSTIIFIHALKLSLPVLTKTNLCNKLNLLYYNIICQNVAECCGVRVQINITCLCYIVCYC